jgi:uncharacterized protein involved in outer membrane biogenesis
MSRPIRTALLLVSSLVVLAVVVLLLAWWLVDIDQAGKRLETRLGDAVGMDVEIGQPLRPGLLGGVSITFSDIEMSSEGQVIARADHVRIRLALASLLTGNLRPTELQLQRPELEIERISPGQFNVRLPEAEREILDEFSLRRVQLSDVRLRYVDRESDLEWLFEDCDLELHNLAHAGGQVLEALATLAADGDLHCKQLSQERFVVSELSAAIRADQGVLELDPVTAIMFDGEAAGQLTVDFTSGPPQFSLVSQLSQFDLAAFMAMLEPEPSTTGRIDLEVDVNAQGQTWQEVRNSTSGSIRLTSGELVLEGHDLDKELDDYSATQRFNLVDVGAVFLAGPVGLIASRGYAFTGLISGGEGSTHIDQMLSQWTVEDGVAKASDVAFRTPENRLALTGGLDFNDYHFKDLKVAVVDSDGCAVIEQRITGPFREPSVEQPNILVAVAGPFLDLLERGVQAITGSECEAFYTGSIAHP